MPYRIEHDDGAKWPHCMETPLAGDGPTPRTAWKKAAASFRQAKKRYRELAKYAEEKAREETSE